MDESNEHRDPTLAEHSDSTHATRAGGRPAGEAPAADTPAGDAPAGDAPPAGEAPAADTPAGGTPAAPGDGEAPHLWLSRRQMLAVIGAGGVAGAGYLVLNALLGDDASPSPDDAAARRVLAPPTTGSTTATTAAPSTADMARWSDAATWGGRVPGDGDTAVVDKAVLLDVDARVAGVRIGPEGRLVFDPAATRTLASTGNVTVEGALRMVPEGADATHKLVFEDVDESAFVGAHTHEPLDTDVGLWVTGAGVLDLKGAQKVAWTHAAGALEAGATTLAVDDATGWQPGDEIVVTPTEGPQVDGYSEHHDRRVVTAVHGSTLRLDRPLDHPHPTVTVRDGLTYRPEVLNLTRNVAVEGTENGRAHIMILASAPQHLAYVGMRHLGPQQDEEGVLGRYGCHFHMAGDGVRGSVVEGAVVYDGGGHAFVAHLSNGVTFRDCISHDTAEDPYWWDPGSEDDPGDTPSNDIVYERCVAHLARYGSDKYGLAGWVLGAGAGNVARDCVAVAIMGGAESSSGFTWPANSRDGHLWTFEGNVAHDIPNSGIYFWQNNVGRTITDRFTAYHCDYGIIAGAYSNLASYRDTTIYGCATTGLRISALPDRPSSSDETITYEGLYVDQAGLSDYAVDVSKHLADSGRETLVRGCTFRGGNRAQVGFPSGGENHQLYHFEDCTFDGNEFWLADDVPESTRVRVTDGTRGAIVVRRSDQPGTARPQWNAAVSQA